MPTGAAKIGFRFLPPKPQIGTSINFSADFLVLSYEFTDGRDLDTRTRIISPLVGTDYLGWGRSASSSSIITWGGDNVGTGVESVCIDFTAFRASYPSITNLVIDCRCMWFGTKGINPVKLKVVLYKGGSVVSNASFGFTSYSATGTLSLTSDSKIISTFSQAPSNNGERLATISYDLAAGVGAINSNDTTTF